MDFSNKSRDNNRVQLPPPRSYTDVSKSIDLLRDAVKTPGLFENLPSLGRSEYTPLSFVSSSMFNDTDAGRNSSNKQFADTPLMKSFTSMVTATPGSLSFKNTLLGQMCEDQEFRNFSRVGAIAGKTALEESLLPIDTNLLLHEDPASAACHGMFADFTESFRRGLTQAEMFEPLVRYAQICEDNIKLLKSLAKRSVPSHSSFIRITEMLSLLKAELQTWRLVISLFSDRLTSEKYGEDINDTMMMLGDDSIKQISEKKLIDKLFECDSVVRQAQLVVDWLENGIADELEELYHKVEYSVDKMGAWENTLDMLKRQKASGPIGIARSYVSHLDPDAPLRQGRQLLDQDVEDDIDLLQYIFACIRGGQVDEARRVCVKVGQMWRAATLSGWKLYNDPNVDELGQGGTVQSVEGNQYRDIWKCACWKASENDSLPEVERAIYAALCGNLAKLLPYCKSWHDYVWAYFRTMVDQRVENYIHVTFTGPRLLHPLPENYIENIFTPEKIFAEIQSSPVEKIRQQSSSMFSQMQKFIITGDIDSLVCILSNWCMDTSKQPSGHLLRFICHLILFMRSCPVNIQEGHSLTVLESYVKLLIDDKQVELVATYVATLPKSLQIFWYAKFLEGIQGTELRRHCLDLAMACNLDVPQITKLVVENIRSKYSPVFLVADAGTLHDSSTNEEDQLKIDALEWLIFNPEQRAEAVFQANAMMRIFLGLRKLQACRLVVRKLPSDSLGVIHKAWELQAGNDELPAGIENAMKEYLCYVAYLDAHDSFTDWFEHYHNAKPKQPELSLLANFNERVAHEQYKKQYEQENDRWKHSLDIQTNATVERIYNVLLFAGGGWLIDTRTDGAVDESRRHQMSLLRQLCLPLMCELLRQVLHTTERYRECIQIADCIASEHHELYKVFRTDELQHFLKKIRLSSVALLDAGLDPLGYNIS